MFASMWKAFRPWVLNSKVYGFIHRVPVWYTGQGHAVSNSTIVEPIGVVVQLGFGFNSFDIRRRLVRRLARKTHGERGFRLLRRFSQPFSARQKPVADQGP